MERLTERDSYGDVYVKQHDYVTASIRLASYEDTGLSPEDVERLNDFERTQAGYLLEKLNAEQKRHRWIPVEERLPDPDEYVLVSFENFSIPMIGRCTVDDDDSGTFRIGDDDESFVQHDLFVNAWMPLPEPYRMK